MSQQQPATTPSEQSQIPSVWAAMDTLQLCYTPIPQIKHYYRYGTLRDCSSARRELFFAMSLKSKSEEEAIQIARERQEERFRDKITKRTSDGVWTLRTEPPPNFPPKLDA
ncbi:hypothetical protein BJ741DRAFT_549455 [Chytriomyces cf. hyalinus JEL632]|nr:hypothetical protein BJ741DRAFT_549455 [Chytriomyces cf. hyalinus JEL632]